jgi:peptide deformylase
MTIRPILTAPDPRLQAVSSDVDKVDDEIRKLIDDMAESMYAADGIGLAPCRWACQAVIVMTWTRRKARIAPSSIPDHRASEEMAVFEEGCLGAGNLGRCRTPRPHQASIWTVTATSSFWKPTYRPLLSIDGPFEWHLVIDHLVRLKRSMAIKAHQGQEN